MHNRNPDYRKDLLTFQHEMKPIQAKIRKILKSRDYENIFKDLDFLTSLHPSVFNFADGAEENKENANPILSQIQSQKGSTFKEKIGVFLTNKKILTAVAKGENKDILFLKSMEDADFNIKDEKGNNPLMIAAANGHTSIVMELARKHPELLKEKNKAKETALMLAKKNKHEDCVEILIKARADLLTPLTPSSNRRYST